MVVNLKTPNSDYFERTETLVRYYEDIRKYDVLTNEEELELFEMIKNGNKFEKQVAKEKLINCNQRFVVAVAKRYATNDNILDLINEGNIGLMEALENFKVEKGVKFTTWAVWFIRRAINLYCINYGNLVRKTNLSQTYHVVSQATNKFIQTEYRQPTLEELAELLKDEHDVDIKNLSYIIDTKFTSIDEGFNSNDDDSSNVGEMNVFNEYSASFNDYEKVSNNEFNNKLISNMLLKLPKREKDIITLYFGIGYDREYELQEIAEKVGLTTERVRQLKNDMLDKLKISYKNAINTI